MRKRVAQTVFICTCLAIFFYSGLAIVFAEDTPDIKAADPTDSAAAFLHYYNQLETNFIIIDQWSELCPLYNELDPDIAIQ